MHKNYSEFRNQITKKINSFKRVYRSNTPFFLKANISIKEMHIDRKSIKNYSDKQLYSTVQKMTKTIDIIIATKSSPLYEHKGLTKFTEEITILLQEYTEINNTIIHMGKYASRIYMNLMQEIHSAIQQKCQTIDQEIITKIYHLKKINHLDTLKNLNTALENIREADINLYLKLKKIKTRAII